VPNHESRLRAAFLRALKYRIARQFIGKPRPVQIAYFLHIKKTNSMSLDGHCLKHEFVLRSVIIDARQELNHAHLAFIRYLNRPPPKSSS
jgi:hypothetical protein